MSMIEQTTAAPKRKRKARRAHRAAPVAPKPVAAFAGLTVTDCPKACGIDGCVISGTGYCAHPRKGGLQGRQLSDGASLERLKSAQKALGKRALDARYG